MRSPFINRITFIVLGLAVPFAFVPLSGLLPKVAAQSAGDSVTGHVEFINTISVTKNHDRYSLSAIRHLDGTVSGEIEEHVRTADGDFVRSGHGTILCFTINGNIARIGGIVDHVTVAPPADPPPPGTPFILTVVDNGQGDNDPPDVASTPATVSSLERALFHCSDGVSLRLMFPAVRGNIQVRSGS